ncbi:MAG: DUF7482 domain-containing protein [Candidatus Nitrosocosmicus sp.]
MIFSFSSKEKLLVLIIVAVSVMTIHQINWNLVFAQNSSNTSKESNITSISIPVSKGYVNGKIAYFISTDATEKQIVSSVSNTTKFIINYAPVLADTPQSTHQQGYVFINGIKGGGQPNDFQLPVASAIPNSTNSSENKEYSPLFQINYVKWNNNSNPRILTSVDQIMDAQNKGELTIIKTNIVINSPFIQIK